MKVFRKLFAIVLACTLIGTGLFYKPILPIVTAADTDYTEQLKNDKLSPIIYRTSVEGTNVSNTWNFIFSLVARENGNIHINVQSLSSGNAAIQDIGNIAFNDGQIAAFGEVGANGISDCSPMLSAYGRLIESYSSDNIVYTCIYSDGARKGDTVFSINLYVKELYLTTNQIINLFGTEVEIPFGNPPIDKDTYIEELENKVTELENKITELESNPITPYKPGDINGDGIIDATDASSILCYYAYVMTGGDGNLNILDFVENEDEYMAANATSTTTTIPTTTTTTTQTTTTTATTPSMDIGGSKSNYESEFSSNNRGGIRNQFDKKPMG